jgi:sugar phosphate permease
VPTYVEAPAAIIFIERISKTSVEHNSISRTNWPEPVQKLYHQRWRIWIVACLAHTIGMYHRAALAPMADRIMADFDISAVAFGSLGAVYFYIYAVMQLPSGNLADTLGPRKTITAGLLLSGIGSLVMSIAPTFGILYVGRILVSFGASTTFLSITKLLMEWFHRKQLATMTGLTGTVINLGQLAAATPLALLIMWVGWRMSLVVIVLVTFALAVASWFIIKDSPTKVTISHTAELKGQTAKQVDASSGSPGLSLAQRFKIIFSNKQLWFLFMLSLGTYGAYVTLFNNWVVVYIMQTYGVQRYFAANFMFIATIGFMAGSTLSGFFSDRIGQRRRLTIIVFISLALTSLLLLTLWNSGKPPLGAIYPLCFFIGLGSGVLFLNFALVNDLVQPSVRGIASGLVNMGGFVGAAIAQPLFGYILDLGWEGGIIEGARLYPLAAFQKGLLLCCVLLALGLLGALLIKETHVNKNTTTGEQKI